MKIDFKDDNRVEKYEHEKQQNTQEKKISLAIFHTWNLPRSLAIANWTCRDFIHIFLYADFLICCIN